MASFPEGIEWPPLELESLVTSEEAVPLALYVHVPFCEVRCGYCDFNTYTAQFGPGADRQTYADSVCAEIKMSKKTLIASGSLSSSSGEWNETNRSDGAQTVFFGGGTPTLLSPEAIGQILTCIREEIGIADGAEITVEANPETVTRDSLMSLKEYGVTRISVGMQSAVLSVLKTLDRVHNPDAIPKVSNWVREAGLQLSLDLIYGAPGESLADWATSLSQALNQRPDHISIYSLIIEPGTKLFAQVQRGELPEPDEDEQALKYEYADRILSQSGFCWYEISNYARNVDNDEKTLPSDNPVVANELKFASQHNLAYWRGWNWWGYGPGAHSHLGKTRWWNVKHPLAYSQRINSGNNPAHQGEILDRETAQFEKLMLGIRTSEGLSLDVLSSFQEHQSGKPQMEEILNGLLDEQLISEPSLQKGQLVLTLKGRLMADYVTRAIAGW